VEGHLVTDPWAIDASAGAPAYSSAELRRLHAGIWQYNGRTLGGKAGVRPGGTGLETSIAGSTITVKAGCGLVDPALTTTQGPYWVALATDETHTLTAAHATLARKDITVLRVYDHTEDSSGQRMARSEYIVGTAAGSPAEPAVPAGSFRLATIDVPASGGGSPVVTINAPYTVANGAVLPVRTQAERALLTAYDGMAIYRRDRDWVEIYDGAAWRVQGVAICSTTTDRDSAVTNPHTGLLAWITGIERMTVYNGSAWVTKHWHTTVRRVQRSDGATLATSTSTTPQVVHTVALTGLKVSTTYNVFARCTAFSNAANDKLRLTLYKTSTAGTLLDTSTEETQVTASGDVHGLWFSYDYTTGGAETAVTFVVAGYRAAGSGTVTFRASTDQPYQFRVTEVDDGLDSF
jgi:hypothetical protein